MTLPIPADDPYQILGIDRTAAPEEIKSAYRRASKAAHPDMPGGSAEAFAKVQWAWDLLRDPKRRDQFDKTGRADEAQPDNELAQQISLIMGAIDRALGCKDPDYADIVGSAADWLEQDIQTGQKANRELDKQIARDRKVLKRLRFKGTGVDFIANTLEQRIAGMEDNKRRNREVMARVRAACDKLRDGWDYTVEVRTHNPMGEAFNEEALLQVMRRAQEANRIFRPSDFNFK